MMFILSLIFLSISDGVCPCCLVFLEVESLINYKGEILVKSGDGPVATGENLPSESVFIESIYPKYDYHVSYMPKVDHEVTNLYRL
jgi:hypothetical protein